MQLTNRKTGERLSVNFRSLRQSDAGAVIACIRDAYGDTYVKPYLYDEGALWAHHLSGALRFTVAQTQDGELAGIIATEVSELFPGRAEIACQVILQKFSGFGLALPLALYQMQLAGQGEYQSQFARALGCHLISQKTLCGMDFTHCGFLLSVFDRNKLTTRYQTDGNRKIAQSLAVKRQKKTDAGAVWLPERYLALAGEMYRSLGVTWQHDSEPGVLSGQSQWVWEQDDRHATLLLVARHPGACFAAELDTALAAVSSKSGQTVNLLLNLTSQGSGAAYEAALTAGFIFTGFFPCGAHGEYIILHHPLDIGVDMRYIPYIPAYEPYAAEIRRQLYAR